MVERAAARIADNLAAVRQRIESAAKGSGRAADAVRLVAVTKYVGPAAAAALVEAGCHDLGESRPQELWRKAEALSGRPIRWHLIGHLQTNKVRRTLPLVSLIHSADSLRIIDALDEEGAVQQRRVPVLLEVNVSGDAAKHGFEPDAIEPLLGQFAERRHLEVRGLMAMSGLESDEAATRREFARLRELRDRLRQHCPSGVALDELSMGMSGDFEAAVAEGATIVRVGSALFEGLSGDPT
jgi:pyridoxal phosphate enzyme (YggS family)